MHRNYKSTTMKERKRKLNYNFIELVLQTTHQHDITVDNRYKTSKQNKYVRTSIFTLYNFNLITKMNYLQRSPHIFIWHTLEFEFIIRWRIFPTVEFISGYHLSCFTGEKSTYIKITIRVGLGLDMKTHKKLD